MNDTFYARYHALQVRRHPHGIVEIVMSGEGTNKSGLATADANMHRELAEIWRDVDRDPDARVAVIRGEGKGFSAGGDLALVEDMALQDRDARRRGQVDLRRDRSGRRAARRRVSARRRMQDA